jgi:hypothetical protein
MADQQVRDGERSQQAEENLRKGLEAARHSPEALRKQAEQMFPPEE